MLTSPKIVVFDLDETLGYFTQFGIFYDCLNNYLKNEMFLSENEDFNTLMDLYPELIRPKMFSIAGAATGHCNDNKRVVWLVVVGWW